MQTRAEYMAMPYVDRETGIKRHRAYYGQFVTPALISFVVRMIGDKAIMASVDPHMNDIPLDKWDRLHSSVYQLVGGKIREANGAGGYSLSDSVCVAKEAARQFKESRAN